MKPYIYSLTSLKPFLLLLLSCLSYINLLNAQVPDTKGRDFWLTFPSNISSTATPSLLLSAEVATSGSVTAGSFSTTFTVTPGVITRVTLPASVFLITFATILNNGIHVTALNDITVYGLNWLQDITRQHSSDAYLGLPTDVLGTEYIILTYKNGSDTNAVVNGNQFAIVGTQNATTVTITPTVTTYIHVAGVPYNITLNQGQTYLLRNESPGNDDLSGTTITSTKPIAVFGSHRCAEIPSEYVECNYIVEQLTPYSSWGKIFVTLPLKTRIGGDTFRFLASTDNTTVKVNGVTVAILNRGKFHEMLLTTASQVTADKPILVAQYSNSTSFDNVASDPSMMLVPPYEQILGKYTIATPVSGFRSNFINVVAPIAAIGSIELDGDTIPPGAFSPIGSSGFSGAQLAIALGTHTINGTNNIPFGVSVYGFDFQDAYSYPGGQTFAPVPIVTTLTLTPENGSAMKGDNQCFNALLKDQYNIPVAGVRVNFTVTGVNPQTGFAITDPNGIAQLCYTGNNPGRDSIAASVGLLIDKSEFNWTCIFPIKVTVNSGETDNNANGSVTITPLQGLAPYTFIVNGLSNNTGVFTGLTAGTYNYTVTDSKQCTTSGSFVIERNVTCNLTSSATVNANETDNNANGSATINASGGTAPYTFTVNAINNNTGVFTGLTAGTYNYSVTDSKQCTSSGSFVIERNVTCNLTSSATVNNDETDNNANGSANINASGGTAPYTFTVNAMNNNNTGVFTGLIAGTYNYTVTDVNECTSSGSFVIERNVSCNLTSSATVNNDETDNNANGSATINASGGTAPYMFTVNAMNNNTGVFTGLTAGTYNYTVTDVNECTSSGSFVIERNVSCNFTSSATVNANETDMTANGMATITTSGGRDPFTFTINGNSNTTGVFAGLTAGTYNYSVSDSRQCTSTGGFVIQRNTTPPTCKISINIIIIANETEMARNGRVTITASGGTPPYTFSANGISNTTGIFAGLSAGSYNFSVVDSKQCTSSGSFTILRIELPKSSAICPRDTTIITNAANCIGQLNWTEPSGTYPDSIPIAGRNALILKGVYNGHGYYQTNVDSYLYTEGWGISITRGGHLVTINDAGENAFIYNTITRFNTSGTWIGLRNEGFAGNFKWLTGEPLNYTNWYPGRPDNIGGDIWTSDQPYVHIIGNDPLARWNDTSNVFMSFITEYESPLITYTQISGPAQGSMQSAGLRTVCYERTNNVTGQKDTCCFNINLVCSPVMTFCPKDTTITVNPATCFSEVTWTVPSDTYPDSIPIAGRNALIFKGTYNGHGYYQTNVGSYLWTEGWPISQNLGGHLVTINDAGENDFIYNAITRFNTSGTWIGMRNEGFAGNFKWVTGEPLNYTNWYPGRPDNIGGDFWTSDQPYVHIIGNDPSARWNDTSKAFMSFITEYESPLITFKHFSGPFNGLKQVPGVYTVCYERTNILTGEKDVCCFNVTVVCNENAMPLSTSHKRKEISIASTAQFNATASPNPSNHDFTIRTFTDNQKDKITMRVIDIYGRVIEVQEKMAPNTLIKFGSRYSKGVYFTQIIQGNRKVILKLIKQ